MAILRSKDAFKMNQKERIEKIKELKLELLKATAANKKTGKQDPREIRKTIARLETINRAEEIKSGGKK